MPPAARSASRKTAGLKGLIETRGFTGIVAGIRRDEEGTRAKERVFSPRGTDARWNFRDQPPEFWDQYLILSAPGCHTRVHPLLHWTELDVCATSSASRSPSTRSIWRATASATGRSAERHHVPVASNAATLDEIIAELEVTRVPERAGRAMDHETETPSSACASTAYM